jgi:hypothetical protein
VLSRRSTRCAPALRHEMTHRARPQLSVRFPAGLRRGGGPGGGLEPSQGAQTFQSAAKLHCPVKPVAQQHVRPPSSSSYNSCLATLCSSCCACLSMCTISCPAHVQVNDLVTSPADRERLFAEIRVLKQVGAASCGPQQQHAHLTHAQLACS